MSARTLHVDVTQDDIDAPGFCEGDVSGTCMLATALQRTLGVDVSVTGYADGTHWAARIGEAHVPLPTWVGEQGCDWDIEPEDVSPFAFTLDLANAWDALPESVRQVMQTYGGPGPLLAMLEATDPMHRGQPDATPEVEAKWLELEAK